MEKIFTCKELGGVCDVEFSGKSLAEIIQKAMPHMMSDDIHKESIMSMEKRTGENQQEWMTRMQKEFDQR